MTTSLDSLQALVQQSRKDSALIPELSLTLPISLNPHSDKSTVGEVGDSLSFPLPANPDEARKRIQAIAAKGIKRIFLYYNDCGWCGATSSAQQSMFDSVLVFACIDEAKKNHITLTMHSSGMNNTERALDAGISGIEYGVNDGRLNSSVIDQFLVNPTNYVPLAFSFEMYTNPRGALNKILADSFYRTAIPPAVFQQYSDPAFILQLEKQYPAPPNRDGQHQAFYDNCNALVKAYFPVQVGTDMPLFPGIAVHEELEYLVKAGLSPMQAIVSATGIAGEYLNLKPKAGYIYSKLQADLLVLDKNPLEDIRNTRSISMIMKRGLLFTQKDLLKKLLK